MVSNHVYIFQVVTFSVMIHCKDFQFLYTKCCVCWLVIMIMEKLFNPDFVNLWRSFHLLSLKKIWDYTFTAEAVFVMVINFSCHTLFFYFGDEYLVDCLILIDLASTPFWGIFLFLANNYFILLFALGGNFFCFDIWCFSLCTYFLLVKCILCLFNYNSSGNLARSQGLHNTALL